MGTEIPTRDTVDELVMDCCIAHTEENHTLLDGGGKPHAAAAADYKKACDRYHAAMDALYAALASRETVECEKCGFRYGAEHHDDGKPGVYTCPVCELASREQDTERLDWLQRKGMVLVAPDFTPDTSGELDWRVDDDPDIPLRLAIDDAMIRYPASGVPPLSERRANGEAPITDSLGSRK